MFLWLLRTRSANAFLSLTPLPARAEVSLEAGTILTGRTCAGKSLEGIGISIGLASVAVDEEPEDRDRDDCLRVRPGILRCEAWGPMVRSHVCESVRRIAVSDLAVQSVLRLQDLDSGVGMVRSKAARRSEKPKLRGSEGGIYAPAMD